MSKIEDGTIQDLVNDIKNTLISKDVTMLTSWSYCIYYGVSDYIINISYILIDNGCLDFNKWYKHMSSILKRIGANNDCVEEIAIAVWKIYTSGSYTMEECAYKRMNFIQRFLRSKYVFYLYIIISIIYYFIVSDICFFVINLLIPFYVVMFSAIKEDIIKKDSYSNHYIYIPFHVIGMASTCYVVFCLFHPYLRAQSYITHLLIYEGIIATLFPIICYNDGKIFADYLKHKHFPPRNY